MSNAQVITALKNLKRLSEKHLKSKNNFHKHQHLGAIQAYDTAIFLIEKHGGPAEIQKPLSSGDNSFDRAAIS